jgi:hypothetical protein
MMVWGAISVRWLSFFVLLVTRYAFVCRGVLVFDLVLGVHFNLSFSNGMDRGTIQIETRRIEICGSG